MLFNFNLIYIEINPFITIVLCWAGIFLFFAGISFWFWVKGNRIKKSLKDNPDIQFFENVEIHVVSKSKLSYNFSIPCKIDVVLSQNEIHFLPGKFNIFLLTNLIPSSVNYKLGRLICEPQFSKSVKLNFDTDLLETFFKPLYLLRTNFEYTLTFETTIQRNQLENLII